MSKAKKAAPNKAAPKKAAKPAKTAKPATAAKGKPTKASAKAPKAAKAKSTKAKAANAKPTKAATKQPAVAQPMSDRQRQFLADIIANPDDKKARLVYADLLQEQGDPRGEFIILQCTQADLPPARGPDPQRDKLEGQIREMLDDHKKSWTSFAPAKGARWEFRRGFVEKLSLDAAELLTHADAIFATEPIEELSIWKIDESKQKVGGSRLAPILALPLHRIRRLSLARCKLTEEDLEALASATTLGSVEVLDLSNKGSVEIPLAPLAAATSLPKLRELKIGGTMCGDDAMIALAQSKTLRFQQLDAPRIDLTAKGAAAIAGATWAPGLEYLNLSSNEQLRDEGLEALASSTQLGALKTLFLEYTGLYERAADLMLGSPVFGKLAFIDVGSNALDYAKIEPVFGDRLFRR